MVSIKELEVGQLWTVLPQNDLILDVNVTPHVYINTMYVLAITDNDQNCTVTVGYPINQEDQLWP